MCGRSWRVSGLLGGGGGAVAAGGDPADPSNAPIATGPTRDLGERVRITEQALDAVAYVPTVRKKPTDEANVRCEALATKMKLLVTAPAAVQLTFLDGRD